MAGWEVTILHLARETAGISLSSNLFRRGCVADGIALSGEWGGFPVMGAESGGISLDKGRKWGDFPMMESPAPVIVWRLRLLHTFVIEPHT